MRKKFLITIILLNLILWGSLVYYFKVYPFDDRIIIEDRNKIAELGFFKYSHFDSAKFILKDECIYVNPPDYDKYGEYFDNRPFDKAGQKMVILTKNTRLHVNSLIKLLRRESISSIYLPFSNLNFKKNRELLDVIKEKNIFFRFYFDVNEIVGSHFKLRFVYPFMNTKKRSGGFILSFLNKKLAFFSDVASCDRKKLIKLLEKEDISIAKLPSNGNFCSYGLKAKYIVVIDDLSTNFGIMKMKYHLFYSKKKKKIFRTLLNGNIRIFADERKFLFYSEII
ncbi:hypothetical protein KAJ27_22330 [bacterium]|nr:hypothetical protein [bacterium]